MAYRKLEDSIKEECIRLRVKDGLSIKKIKELTGVSQGTLSRLLRDYPLPEGEAKKRHRLMCKNKIEEKSRRRKKYLLIESDLHKLTRDMDCLKKSRIVEAAVFLRMLSLGYDIYASPFDGDKADWVISKDNGIWKIQVKTASLIQESDKVSFNVNICGRTKYKDGDFDFLVAYDLYKNKSYIYKFDEIKHRFTVIVDKEHEEKWDTIQ